MRAFASLLIAAFLVGMPTCAKWVEDEHQSILRDISIACLKESRRDDNRIISFVCVDFFRKTIAESRLVMIGGIRGECIINETHYEQPNSLRASLSEYSLYHVLAQTNLVLSLTDSGDIRPNLVWEEKEPRYIKWLSSDLIALFAQDLNGHISLFAHQIFKPNRAAVEREEPCVQRNVACRRTSDIFDTVENIHMSAVLANVYAVASDSDINSYPRPMVGDKRLFGCISADQRSLSGDFSVLKAVFYEPQLPEKQPHLAAGKSGQCKGKIGELPCPIRQVLLGGGILVSLSLLLCCFGCMFWAGDYLYRQRYFPAAALLLFGWGLLFLSWSAWGPCW